MNMADEVNNDAPAPEPVAAPEPAVIPTATKDRLAMLEDRVAELERTAGIPSPVAA
jgi:hypothetical protein